MVSLSPWKTIAGTIRGFDPAGPRCVSRRRTAIALHRRECRGHVSRRTTSKSRMHADRGVQIGVGVAHDGGRGASRRKPRNVDAPRVDGVVAHHFARNSRDERGLASIALLVGRAEPVPAFLHVGRTGLPGVGDEAGPFFGRRIHARAGSEIVGGLGAAVQHDDQGHGLAMVAAGHVELIGPAAGLIAECAGQEFCAVRQIGGDGVGALWPKPPGNRNPRWPTWSIKPRNELASAGLINLFLMRNAESSTPSLNVLLTGGASLGWTISGRSTMPSMVGGPCRARQCSPAPAQHALQCRRRFR